MSLFCEQAWQELTPSTEIAGSSSSDSQPFTSEQTSRTMPGSADASVSTWPFSKTQAGKLAAVAEEGEPLIPAVHLESDCVCSPVAQLTSSPGSPCHPIFFKKDSTQASSINEAMMFACCQKAWPVSKSRQIGSPQLVLVQVTLEQRMHAPATQALLLKTTCKSCTSRWSSVHALCGRCSAQAHYQMQAPGRYSLAAACSKRRFWNQRMSAALQEHKGLLVWVRPQPSHHMLAGALMSACLAAVWFARPVYIS